MPVDGLVAGCVPGQLLATHQYAPASVAGQPFITSTTLTPFDATNCTLAFTVPQNGIVDITADVCCAIDNQTTTIESLDVALLNHTGGAQVGYTISDAMYHNEPGGHIWYMHYKWHLTPSLPGCGILVSGAVVQLDFAAAVSDIVQNTGSFIAAQGTTGSGNNGAYAPFIMQAFASI